MKSLSKEEIKDRLIRRAADTWGVDEMEIEYSFDPIVGILFDACSHEFERISETIKTSRTKITERLVDLLTPEISVTAKPAHAVMHALPLDSQIEINGKTQFFNRKRMPLFNNFNGREGFTDFFFCPSGDFTLNNCELKYIAYPDKIVSYGNQRSAPWLTKGDFSGAPESSAIYLGIQPGKDLKELKELLCYFDLLNFSNKELLVHHLGIAEWSVNGMALEVTKGFPQKEAVRDDYSAYINEGIQSKIQFYEDYVRQYYEDHFYTIEGQVPLADNLKPHPEIFKEFLSEKDIAMFQEPLLWIKISFSSVVSTPMLENLHCHINCFPILNKKTHSTSRRLQSYFNIIPMESENDFFLDVSHVEGDTGNKYYVHNRDKKDEVRPQAYLRFGGVSRFDERDASELLNYTLDLLKEDSVAFSAMGDDFINSNLKDLKQIVSRIEQQIELRGFKKNKIPYLIINKNSINKNRDTIIYADYWTTSGEKANKINPYSKLHQYSGTAFKPESLVLITGTLGGHDEPSPSEKIYAYREHILSRGRIITRQDIVQHCYAIFKDSITKVSIKKGVMVSRDNSVGYTPTTDIYITQNSETNYSEDDWEHLKKELLIGIKTRSANVLPFRVFYTST
ncbi:type VI secretion system baseplate subunit TssF [Zobellia galactanivorans]|uniref:Type VI secretion system baseplate subunit TssF n=1 Tax=Zobellia galactanivorans (strain DSM 12802 / CCUG 47099 / CIP 106680 / NCIMB 13871 / Dsij) TaxID=63186 RepID=G0L9C2_ZOBGA|nr:type VI secretion system baseplate subunit TssF [Zobellia galactanivorans]CAZ94480.1 Conserved hypothetical protein [Zobellia galactanivorans]